MPEQVTYGLRDMVSEAATSQFQRVTLCPGFARANTCMEVVACGRKKDKKCYIHC